jgi:hypothetical protein
MAIAIPIMMVAGAAISAYGAMQQSKAQAEAATYNANRSERDAQMSLEQAGAEASMLHRRTTQQQGSLIAAYGAAGVTADGSPTEVLRMSAENASLDEQTILYRGRVKATGYGDETTLNRMGAKTATEAGYYGAASSLLTGFGRAGSSYTSASRGTPITGVAVPQ